MSNLLFASAATCVKKTQLGSDAGIFLGDCFKLLPLINDNSVDLVFSSPPYYIGKEYDDHSDISGFIELQAAIFSELVRVLKPGGSLCWQVGSHVKDGIVNPLDYYVFAESLRHKDLRLRNRIIWTFGHGLHCSNRFSGRHETVLWFSKGEHKKFNLDAVRVPQKYPGKTHTSGPNKGLPSGNPLGKNPGDVWEIPNVKAGHVEKTDHPCQFPVALAQRFVRALTNEGDLVLDPFAGVCTTGVASIVEKRKFLGAETEKEYAQIGAARLAAAQNGNAPIRPWDREILVPTSNMKVARAPSHFKVQIEGEASLPM